MADNVTMVWSKEGLVLTLSYAVNKTTPTDLVFRAFNNSVTITENTILSDLVESPVSIAVTLDPANWTVSYTTQGEAVYTIPFDVLFTGIDNINGGYITDTANTVLIAAGNFASSIDVTSGQLYIISSVTLTKDN